MQRSKPEPTIAERHRSNSVPAAGGAVRVPVDLRIIVGMEINKPGGHNQPAGINHLGGIAAVKAANLGDLAILDANVGTVPRHACAIYHCPASDQSIKLCHRS